MKVGCCGWNGFKGRKEGMSVLQSYAEVFEIVEVNSTFYKLPRISTCEKWRREVDEVNEEFEFTVKANKAITHEDRFSSTRSIEIFEEMRKICEALRSKILLLQTPPSFRATEESIRNFREFLKMTERNGLKIAVELRHKSWDDEILKPLLEEFSLIHCVDPFSRDPLMGEPAYFRLHGSPPGEKMYRYRYTDYDLQFLKKKIEEYKNSYTFFNNIFMYEDAKRFLELVR
jgi:uncharacterized protein YecE (DUF72 family)